MHIKEAFKEKYSRLTHWEKYKRTVEQFRRKSIRVNTLKSNVQKVRDDLLLQGWELTPIPWCKEGFYIEGERRDIGNLEEHKEGKFFIQRSTSMLPVVVLNPNSKDKVLDMCAAPGGKTTHMAALMKNKGHIIANEPFKNRMKELNINLQRCSVQNVVVTQQPGEKITGMQFDKILVDAPCSNSGSFKGKTKKSAEIMKLWNEKRVKRFAKMQKKLLLHAYNLLKPKGIVVYATCSLDPEEDEQVVDYVVEKTGAKLLKINVPIKGDGEKYLKIWPQYQNTDGFFVAKLQKV